MLRGLGFDKTVCEYGEEQSTQL